MFDKDALKIINENYPKKAKDIVESIGLLNLVLNELMNKINQDVSIALRKNEYDLANSCTKLHQHINNIYKKNRATIEYIEGIASDKNEFIEEEMAYERNPIPNYDDYKVDQAVAHTLYEDFAHKRPIEFKLLNNTVEVSAWINVFIETCEILYKMNSKLFTSFAYDKNMNGKKRNYFSLTGDNIRVPKKLRAADIYVETNLSANQIRQIIVKMLKRYKIELEEFKVYYRADYSELNKN